MERLTYKREGGYSAFRDFGEQQIIDTLGAYEDAEEQGLLVRCSREPLTIEQLKERDGKPVVHAMWIKIDSEVEGVCKCSGCKFPVSYFWGKSKYCPNCGAKMDGKEPE